MSFGLIAAMEDIAEEVPVDENEAAEVAVAVADESAEVQADSEEIGTSVAQIEDAVQAGDELEDIGEVAAEAVESGEGLDEKSAEIASIAIESIRNRLGAGSAVRLVPACESFGNSNTRLTSTKLIVEGVNDFIKKVWTAIKQAAARIWDKIKLFFAKIFNSAGALAKHIQSLKARAAKIPSTAQPREKMIKSSIARAISVGGKANKSTFDDVFKNSETLSAAAADVSKLTRDIVTAAERLAGSEINEANVSAFIKDKNGCAASVVSALSKSFSGLSTSLAAAATKGAKPAKGANEKIETYGPFIGGEALILTTYNVSVANKTSEDFAISFGPMKGTPATEVAALTTSEVKEILEKAGSIANKLADFKKTQSNMDAITKSVNKIADTVLSQAQKLLDKTGSSTETRQGLQELKNSVNNTLSTLNGFGNKAPAMQFNMAKVAADYASLCMRNLGEKEAK